jgi:hypothetical protein
MIVLIDRVSLDFSMTFLCQNVKMFVKVSLKISSLKKLENFFQIFELQVDFRN